MGIDGFTMRRMLLSSMFLCVVYLYLCIMLFIMTSSHAYGKDVRVDREEKPKH